MQGLLAKGYPPVYIRELTGHTYKTIRKYKSGEPDLLCRNLSARKKRKSKLDSFASIILQKLSEGMILKDIFMTIEAQGYKGKLTNFYSYCKILLEENDIEYHTSANTSGIPINRTKLHLRYVNRGDIFDFMWGGIELDYKDNETIFDKYPILSELHTYTREFREIINKKSIAYLHLFIDEYKKSNNRNLKSFVNGMLRDLDAIENAVSSTFNNGFLEGNNSRLKIIKRMMYGKAGLKLLKAKVIT